MPRFPNILREENSRTSQVGAPQLVESLTLTPFRTWRDLQELEPAWKELVENYACGSIFCTWEWLTSWWCSFGKGRRLLVLAMLDEASKLVGLAPLSISTEKFLGPVSTRVLRLMGDGSGESDNLDLPVRRGFAEQIAKQLLQYLHQHSGEWDVAEFNTLPPESPVGQCLENLLRGPGWNSFKTLRSHWTVPLPSRWDDYLERLSTEDQKNLMRYDRRLRKKYSVRMYRCSREDDLATCLDALFRLHQARWRLAGEPGTFASPERRQFYVELGQQLLAVRRLELWVAELDGRIAAVQFAMRYADRVYQLQEGYDPQHASERVGFLLRAEVLKQLISEGVRVYDFLGGDDRFKARWGASAGRYHDLHFARGFTRGSALLSCKCGAHEAKEGLRTHLPPSLWRILHRTNLALRKAGKVSAS